MPPKDSTAVGNARKMELYAAITKQEPALNDSCFTEAATELLSQMLCKKEAGRTTIPQVRMSPFFADFDWAEFHAQRMPPPFVPERHPELPTPR